jgi:hypothetical protein
MSDDPRLAVLGQFTPEGTLTHGHGDHYLFFVGRDDVHSILHYLISRETLAFRCNMFGFADPELNDDIMTLMRNPSVHVSLSLDRVQASGAHEKALLAEDAKLDSETFAESVVVMTSATHDIDHTKGGVLSGQGIGFEGSVNWSASGEGTGVSLKADVKNPKGYHAQNNTLLVSTNPVFLSRFAARLDVEHQIGLAQAAKRLAKGTP